MSTRARQATRYRDRPTGMLVEEKVFGERALFRLYHSVPGRLLTRAILRHRFASRLYGMIKRSPQSRREIASFVQALSIDASEADRPLDDYRSLDDFFARRLRPEARPIDRDPSHLVSPCDGRALAFPRVADDITVKGSTVPLPTLCGDAELARRYRDGSALVVRLAPADYHRFHFPDDGNASPSRALGGHLDSVHPIALAAGARSFENRRTIAMVTSAGFGDLVMIEVGALLVGSIIQTYRPGYVPRGSEKGLFRFGGSTVMLLAEAGRLLLDDDLIASTREETETLVRMGSRIGRRP